MKPSNILQTLASGTRAERKAAADRLTGKTDFVRFNMFIKNENGGTVNGRQMAKNEYDSLWNNSKGVKITLDLTKG